MNKEMKDIFNEHFACIEEETDLDGACSFIYRPTLDKNKTEYKWTFKEMTKEEIEALK